MSGSTFGKLFSVTTWGESHGPAIGAVIDGCPAGLALAAEDIQKYLDRRKPGQSRYTTARKEGDQVQILSGVFEGRTTGTPVSVVVFNEDQRSRDYSNIKDIYRPGHADYSYDAKYGFRDYRGGGRSSGRETIGRVAAGAIAAKLLKTLGIRLTAYTRAIGPVKVPSDAMDLTVIRDNPLYMPDQEYAKKASAYLETCMQKQDSAGGIVECLIDGVPAGIGDPVFEKLDASLAKAIMSIGAVKGVEIGDGFASAQLSGSQNNDPFYLPEPGKAPAKEAAGSIPAPAKSSNHAGGILGGISDGSRIILRAAIKPTPSISREQSTITRDGKNTTIAIRGRHDPVIVPRAVVVVESMAALALADAMMCNMSARLSSLQDFYRN